MKPISNEEEMAFILQAAVAPFSIIKRVFFDKKSLGISILQTIDRDVYVKEYRKNKEQK